jgi:hypothetical protein
MSSEAEEPVIRREEEPLIRREEGEENQEDDEEKGCAQDFNWSVLQSWLQVTLQKKLKGLDYDRCLLAFYGIGSISLITRRLVLPPRGNSDYSRMKTTICGLMTVTIYSIISLVFAFTGHFKPPKILFSVIYFFLLQFVLFLSLLV